MKSHISARALFLGSVASGLVAGAIGPVALLASALASGVPLNVSSAGSFTLEGLGVLLISAAAFGIVGVVAAVSAGFPILAALRKADRLSNISAPLAGAVAGLVAALVLWMFDSFEPRIFSVAGFVGAICGWMALRIANKIQMRPNTSPERTRER